MAIASCGRITICILIISAVVLFSFTDAECCTKEYLIAHTCSNIPREELLPYAYAGLALLHNDLCDSIICYDGTINYSHFCGKGRCNIFGCNCDGGCRDNAYGTKDEAVRLFAEIHGFKSNLTCY